MPIKKSFTGKLAFLSNFYRCTVEINGFRFKNAEAAYQSFKNLDHQIEFESLEANKAKQYAKKIPLRNDWDYIKLDVMYKVVKAKFIQNWYLGEWLIQTNDSDLVEENSWGDTFWGTCNGIGENHLGNILKKIKYEIKGE